MVVRIVDVTKGTSLTMLIGEKYLDRATCTSSPDCNDDQGWTDGWDNDTICFADGAGTTPSPPVPDGSIGTCGLNFGSPHLTQMMCVLCDGSVRSINFSSSAANFLIFCQRNSAAILDMSSF
jgi:hypothetical protein